MIDNDKNTAEAGDLREPDSILPDIIDICREKIQSRQYEAALDLIDSLYHSLSPHDRVPLEGLKADCYIGTGNNDAATESYQRIIDTLEEPPFWARVGYANTLERNSKYEEAVLQMVLALKEEFSIEVLQRAASLSDSCENADRLLSELQCVLLEHRAPNEIIEAGEHLITAGFHHQGCYLLEAVTLDDGSDRAPLVEKMALACIYSGESQLAISKIEKWKVQNPNDIRLDQLYEKSFQSRRLGADDGIPSFTLLDNQSLSDFELFINGFRVSNGMVRYARLVGEFSDGPSRKYLLVLPCCYVDDKADCFLLEIKEKSKIDSFFSARYKKNKLFESDRSLYLGDFEYKGANRIHGWYASLVDGKKELDLYINDEFVAKLPTLLDRPDVLEHYNLGDTQCGFEFSWDDHIIANKIEFRNPVSGVAVLGTPVKIQRIEEAIQQLEVGMSEVLGKNRFTAATVEKIFKVIRDKSDVLTEHTACNNQNISNFTDGISVIIPVYNGLEDVSRCVDSVLSSENSVDHEVLLVNDRSTDGNVETYLKDLELLNPNVSVINSNINRGFVKTVNKGIQARKFKDVVILNSDTIVPLNFIDRFHSTAQLHDQYGVVTPLSNNATIFSFPLTLTENTISDNSELSEIDFLLRKHAANEIFEVPTGHGYCMFVRGEVIASVGMLDEENWGLGYGEENDYCQRVKMHGWKIGAYHGMYVGHVGSVSFGNEKRDKQIRKNLKKLNRIYPEYDRLIQNYIKNEGESRLSRNRLQQLRLFGNAGNRFVLFVTHSLGGGTTEYLNRSVQQLASEGIGSIYLTTQNRDIIVCDPTESLYCVYRNDEIENLKADLDKFHFMDVVINSTFNFQSELVDRITQLSSGYTVVLHDYSYVCPRINLIDASGSFCGLPGSEVCVKCIEVAGTHDSFNMDWKNISTGLDLWLTRNKSLLTDARRIIAPSQDTAHRISERYPDLDISAKYHMDFFEVTSAIQRYRADNLEEHIVGIFGMIGNHKGLHEIKQLCWLLSTRHPGIRVVFFGTMADYDWMEGYDNVSCAGQYSAQSLSTLVSEYKPTFGLFLSKWPETYCYALTDAIQNGVFPIAFDIGAFSERIVQHNYGATVPLTSDVESLYNSILNIITGIEFNEANVERIVTGASYQSFSKDYLLLDGEKTVFQKSKVA